MQAGGTSASRWPDMNRLGLGPWLPPLERMEYREVSMDPDVVAWIFKAQRGQPGRHAFQVRQRPKYCLGHVRRQLNSNERTLSRLF